MYVRVSVCVVVVVHGQHNCSREGATAPAVTTTTKCIPVDFIFFFAFPSETQFLEFTQQNAYLKILMPLWSSILQRCSNT